MEEARGPLLRYRSARDKLRALGVLHTERSVLGNFAEWLVARCLRLHLVESNVQKAYDAVDRIGQTYQIKGRIVSGLHTRTSFDFRRPTRGFEFLVGVLMLPNFDVLAIIRVPYRAVRRYSRLNRNRYSFRWTRRSLSAHWVTVLYRSDKENGINHPGKPTRAEGEVKCRYSAVSRGSSFVVEAPSKGARSRTGTGTPLGSLQPA